MKSVNYSYLFLSLGGAMLACEKSPDEPVTEVKSVEKVIELGATIPTDVDTKQQADLTKAGRYPEVQRLFDELSWQSFVALNWPRDAEGKAKSALTDTGNLTWESYSESYEVFKPDGSKPDPYGAPRTRLPPISKDDLPNQGDAALAAQGHRVLHNLSSTGTLTVLDEVNQAFSSPLWDQRGNLVHYEVLLNESEYDYLVDHELYNLQGQVAFHDKGSKVSFPSGEYGKEGEGAIEIKLAWRILTKDDISSRYLVEKAYVVAENPLRWQEVTVGLVGMHISHKTKSSPQWIWSTFEHVDNLQVNDMAAFGPNAKDHPQVPSFSDPTCEYCPVNVVPEPNAQGLRKTQVSRAVPIPKATQEYNRQIQAQLAELGSVLQYYELVNTQWPTDPSAPPAAIDDYPANITNKSGGKPTPVYLVNSIMETYFQSGAAGDVELVVNKGTPVKIPSTNGGNTPLEYAEGFCASVGDKCGDAGSHLVLSTESCMGCHSSAPIATAGSGTDPTKYTFGGQLSADFSWLLNRKAQPKSGE
jgi:hypothetical protein